MNADCDYCRGLGLDPNTDPAGLCPVCVLPFEDASREPGDDETEPIREAA